tara:strand:- start:286 stop:642 length:357 start_codon:yes stop_codon:yes gene_type:complete
MPLYDYECEGCSHTLVDVKQSFDDNPLSLCPECNEPKLYRVITGGVHSFVKGSNTIGSIADRNASANKNKISEERHRENESKPQETKAWYHKHGTASPKEINSMTNKQKAKYIMEGKK